jgi:hypothetical protein
VLNAHPFAASPVTAAAGIHPDVDAGSVRPP